MRFYCARRSGPIRIYQSKKGILQCQKMIGLDGGGEVSTCTTTSGGRYAYVDKTCSFEEVNKPTYKLIVKGLDGGHSGACIDQERVTPLKSYLEFYKH